MMRKFTAAQAGLAILLGVGTLAAVTLAAPPKHNASVTGKAARIELTDASKLENIVRGKAGNVVLVNIWAST